MALMVLDILERVSESWDAVEMRRAGAFQPNQEVEILFGPFQGRKGIFLHSVPYGRAVITLHLQQWTVDVELEHDMLGRSREPIPG